MPEKTTKFDVHETLVLDADAQVRKNSMGFMLACPRIARVGIQEYRGSEVGMPHLDVVRVYRPEKEVFSKDATASFTHRPITNDHPPEFVDSSNWKKYAVGSSGDEILRDKESFRVPIMVQDKSAIDAVEGGKSQLSAGYTSDLVWGDGVTPEGQEYNAMQTNIRANHIAIVAKARGGPKLRIGDKGNTNDDQTKRRTRMPKIVVIDGLSIEMDDRDAVYVERHIKQLGDSVAQLTTKNTELGGQIAKLTTDGQQKDAEVVTMKKQLGDKDAEIVILKSPATLDAKVKERQATIDKAKLLVPAVVVDERDVADIRKQVVTAKLGDLAKGWTDDQIATGFSTLSAGVKAADTGGGSGHNVQDLAAAFSQPGLRQAQDEADKAWNENNRRMADNWKPPEAAKH